VTGAPPPHALLRPRIALPFLAISLIWGSTWYVITGQIDGVPAMWSVTWRFALATVGMFALVLVTGGRWAMPRRAHLLALAVGLCQFSGNYNFVYQAELHLTSGIVAVLIGLMIVPNAVLGRALLGQAITARFLLGSAIAIGGIALLLVNEAQAAPLGGNEQASPSKTARVTRALRTIERHHDGPMSLRRLARAAGLSPYHFLRTFERLTGNTPHQYVRRARLREAAIRLVDAPARVLDIALDCGFGDISAFNRAFRAEFGVSPTRYRLSA